MGLWDLTKNKYALKLNILSKDDLYKVRKCNVSSNSYRAFYHIPPSFIRQTIHVLPESLEIVIKRVNKKSRSKSMNNVFKSFAMIMKIWALDISSSWKFNGFQNESPLLQAYLKRYFLGMWRGSTFATEEIINYKCHLAWLFRKDQWSFLSISRQVIFVSSL